MAAAFAEIPVGLAGNPSLRLRHRLDLNLRRAQQIIETAAGDYYALADGPNNKRFPPRLGFRPRYLIGDILTICAIALPYLAVLKQAATGDRYAWSRIKHRLSVLFGAGLSTRFGR